MFIDVRVERTVLEVIHRVGIEGADTDAVAAELGRARSSLYRQYGPWLSLLEYTHGRVLESLNVRFITLHLQRRAQFEHWWSEVLEFLRMPYGKAFRALRCRLRNEDLELHELAQLPALFAWVGSDVAIARATWSLILSASGCQEDMREIAWSVAGNAVRGNEGRGDVAQIPGG
jgi:AcrR family transcriptional regulator